MDVPPLMQDTLYQALNGAAVHAAGRVWRIHVDGMVHSRDGWLIRLALVGQPNQRITIRASYLTAGAAPFVMEKIRDWLADPSHADFDTLVIDDVRQGEGDEGERPAAGSPTRPVVLIVDDVPDHLQLYELTLSDRYTVLRASSGRQACEIAYAHKPQVVVLDVMMPDLDGWTVCERLKSNEATATTPVIMMTASAAPDLAARARAAGVVAVLRKPYVIEHLAQTVASALRLAK
jgi:CheY-like chemotaxis protein